MKTLHTLLLPVALAVCGLTAAAAEPSPWDAWRLGYTNYELGEQVRNRGDYSAALEAFEKSRKYYQAVKRARPDWNQKVIRERLTACDKQIAELRKLMGNSEPAEITPPGAPPAARADSAPRKAARPPVSDARYNEAQGKIAVLEHELAALRADQRKKRDYEREMAKLTVDLRRERERSALLEKSCRRLQEELKKPDSALTELRSQLVKKHNQLENSERTVRALEERLRRGEQQIMALNRDRKMLNSQLRQQADEQERVGREAAVQRGALAQMREKEAKLSARISELESALRDAENEARQLASAHKSGGTADSDELVKLKNIVKSAESRAGQFQRQSVALRQENESLLKRLQTLELEHSKSEQERTAARNNAAQLAARVEAVSAELASARDLQRRLEDDLKRALSDSEEQKKRLARRDSDDFKALVEARSRQSAQENAITDLKSRIADLEVTLSEEKKSVAELRQNAGRSKQAMDKLIAEKAALASELTAVSPDAEKFRELYPRYEKLVRNFEALRKENQENRIKLAAASPHEAELKRIKLRLTELDRLKNSLGKEQRLTSELAAAKKRLEAELESMREQGAELALARKQLENLKALRREVQELRKVNRDAVARLERMKKVEDELVAAKKSLIESGAAQLELHELKTAYAKALHERNAAATETAKLRDELIAMEDRTVKERNDVKARIAALRRKLAERDRTAERERSAAASEAEDLRRKLAERDRTAERERSAAVSEAEDLRRKLAERDRTAERERSAAAAETAKLRDELNKSATAANDARNSADDVHRHSAGLATQLEESRQQLQSARQRIEQLENLLPQLAQLKKLNDELMHAKSFESELIRARSALSELSRYKDELAGVIKLNETLVREKSELEKELARRPRLPESEAAEEHLKLVRAARKEKPGDFIADGMLAESKDSVELAIWNYRKALSIDRENPEASELLGKLLLSRGDYAEAAQLLTVARTAAPGRMDLALAVSRAYLGQKRFGNAQAVVEPLLKQYPENGELLTVAALAFAESGNAARAESSLRLALRYLPKGREPRVELARLLIHQDSSRLEEASRLYEEARMLGSRPDPELEPILGPRLDKRRELEAFMTSAMNEAFENRDYNGAVWYCRQLLELNRRPEYFTPMLALARYLGGENGAARETLTFNAESAYGALVLALVELKDGNRQAMSMALRRAVALSGEKQTVIDAHWRNLGFALDAAKTADPSVAGEFERAYQWERAR